MDTQVAFADAMNVAAVERFGQADPDWPNWNAGSENAVGSQTNLKFTFWGMW